MPTYHLICRGVLGPDVIAELVRLGVYANQGGATHPSAPTHRRHQLIVDAANEADAFERARALVREAGGECTDVGPEVIGVPPGD